MGGSAFPQTATRLSTPHLEALKSHVLPILRRYFGEAEATRYLLDKTSHGDLDVLCAWHGTDVGDSIKGLERGVVATPLDRAQAEAESCGSDGTAYAVKALGDLVEGLKEESGRLTRNGHGKDRGQSTVLALAQALDEVVCAIERLRETSGKAASESVQARLKAIEEREGKKRAMSVMCEEVARAVGGKEWIRNGDGLSVKVPCSIVGVEIETVQGKEPPFYQLDFILTPTLGLPLAHVRLSHSSLLLGLSVRVISQSLTLHNTHLTLTHHPFATLKPIQLRLTHSVEKLFQWLGLSYSKWLNGIFRHEADYFSWLTDVEPDSLLGTAWRKMVWETKGCMERGRGYGVLGDKAGGQNIRAQLIAFRKWLYEESRFKDSTYEPCSGRGPLPGGGGRGVESHRLKKSILDVVRPDAGDETTSTLTIGDEISMQTSSGSTTKTSTMVEDAPLIPTLSPSSSSTASPLTDPSTGSNPLDSTSSGLDPVKATSTASSSTSTDVKQPAKSSKKQPKVPNLDPENPRDLSERALSAIRYWGGIHLVEEYERQLEERKILARETVAAWRRRDVAARAAREG